EKDGQSSLDAIIRAMGERIPKSRLDFLLRWSNSTDGVESLTREDDAAPANLFSMGGYRPRRVSISQYEQLSAAAAEGLRREKTFQSSRTSGSMSLKVSQPLRTRTPTITLPKTENPTIQPSTVGMCPPLCSPPRTYESGLMSHHPRNVFFATISRTVRRVFEQCILRHLERTASLFLRLAVLTHHQRQYTSLLHMKNYVLLNDLCPHRLPRRKFATISNFVHDRGYRLFVTAYSILILSEYVQKTLPL
ncbi:hypothetical protein KIN20_026540, partial [Parelaphostrongylus tenuis]